MSHRDEHLDPAEDFDPCDFCGEYTGEHTPITMACGYAGCDGCWAREMLEIGKALALLSESHGVA